jgi:uncharacterized protein YdaU (DUF1376 family)
MAEFPAMPLWTDAYLGDTSHLTTIEHGAYLLLLIAMWRTSEKRLPSDDKLLARYARCTAGQWARMKPILMAFFKANGGFITQSRLTDEANAVRQHSRKQSDKAKARWLKDKETPDAAAVPEPCRNDASLTLTLTHTHKEEDREAKASLVRSRFSEFWDCYPHRDGKRNRAGAEKAFAKASRRVSEQTIIDGARAAHGDRRVRDGFARDPTTWLNQEGWADEVDPNVHPFPIRRSSHGERTDEAFAAAASLLAQRPFD